MHFRIRTKFIGILVIAAVLPLFVALLAANALGYNYYRRTHGVLFETMARHLAHTLSLSINRNIETCDAWLARAALHQRLGRRDEKLQQQLKAFQAANPLFVEIMVIDSNGQLLASTRKQTMASFADLPWWKKAAALNYREVFVQGINDSAGVRSIDLCMPICDPSKPDAGALGVVKIVMNAPPLLLSLDPVLSTDENVRQVVLGNGSIPVRLFAGHVAPLDEPLDPTAVATIMKKRSSWTLATLDGNVTSLVGYSGLRLITSFDDTATKFGTSPIYVLVYNDASAVLAPVLRQLWILGGAGTLLVASCMFVGYSIAGRKIIDPIEKLRTAAHSVASSAKLDHSAANFSEVPADRATSAVLDQIEKIHTGDEIEELSHEFSYMATRVLSYHKQLETEIALKTAEIQGDLQVAKEFQEALMPHHYPVIPASPAPGALRLHFHHVYKAASTVGGDFFDVLKLADNRAGIFIADVMGHGTRSALVTAILRTLVQESAFEIKDPAHFLKILNRHFHAIVRQSGEFLFASAFYLIIDTDKAMASYASAGHPSPFFAERCRRKVSPLFEDLRNNPALGLFADSTYIRRSKAITDGDIFVLFTDGVFEAANIRGEEFGQERLRASIAAHIDGQMSDITKAIVSEVNEFVSLATLPDDLCVVAVEITTGTKS